MLPPLVFQPIFKERIWGGRNLERLFGKSLPPARPIGESWEISDRPGDVSVVAEGPLAGRDLRWLMTRHERELLGGAQSLHGQFPLLVKILDAQDTLSLQVHPPADKAARLQGDPKTEMWYFVEAAPEARLYAGLKRGVARAEFERRAGDGTVAECFHRLAVRAGDAMFVPSGRVHALGAGSVLFEVQQNSDTTYRVFDWNRVDAQGKPRDLHVAQSLESIDFEDFEPGLIERGAAATRSRPLVADPLFSVWERDLAAGEAFLPPPGVMLVAGVVSGRLEAGHPAGALRLGAGQFCLLPASLRECVITAEAPSRLLLASALKIAL